VSDSSDGQIVVPEPKLPEINSTFPQYSVGQSNTLTKYDKPAPESLFTQVSDDDDVQLPLPFNRLNKDSISNKR